MEKINISIPKKTPSTQTQNQPGKHPKPITVGKDRNIGGMDRRIKIIIHELYQLILILFHIYSLTYFRKSLAITNTMKFMNVLIIY